VDRDHRQPGLERLRILEPGERGDGANENVVMQVGEVREGAEDAAEDAVDMAGVASIERGARPRVVGQERGDELGVVPREGDGEPGGRGELEDAAQVCSPFMTRDARRHGSAFERRREDVEPRRAIAAGPARRRNGARRWSRRRATAPCGGGGCSWPRLGEGQRGAFAPWSTIVGMGDH
jgi:hypothetical protein